MRDPAGYHRSAFVYTEPNDVDLVQRLLQGDMAARKDVILRLEPVVRKRVARVLERQGSAGAYDASDLLQDVLILLLEKQDRILGLWDPTRGLSLEGFIGLVAQRTAATILRSGRKTGWAEQATEGARLVGQADLATPELHLAQMEQLQLIMQRVRARLSPRGIALFDAVLDSPEAVERLRAHYRMSAAALHSFRSRLRTLWRVETDAVESCKPENMTADRI